MARQENSVTAEAGDWKHRTLHFIGVGGCGMSGLAMTAHTLGAMVTGSDRAEGQFVSRLRECGIEVTIGHAAANVPARAEIVYSSAVAADNPERALGRDLGLVEHRRGELLAEVAAGRRCIAVGGTHGKTTTAAMTVHALRGAGHDVDYLIGADILATGTNSHWGNGEWLVIETDESDRSLLALAPEVGIVTNVELEHVRVYRSRLELEQVFAQFLAQSEHAVVWDRPGLLKLSAGPVVAFDAPAPILVPGGSRFRWRGFDVTLNIAGEHNARNAAAALEACRLAGAQPARAVAALSSFTGTRRRLEAVGVSPSGALIYDDYAHHPTAVRATLSAARTLEPDRLIAVLQPHSYARTRLMARQFGEALALADLVVVLDVVPGGPTDRPAVSGLRIARAAAAASPRSVAWLPDFESAEGYLASTLRHRDLCVTLGSGNVYQLARRLVA